MVTPTERALAAIADAERMLRDAAPQVPTSHRTDVERVMALPHNQDGADKSWIWPAYEFCRGHFLLAEPG